MRIAIYARCSTEHQDTDHQLKALRDYCQARQWAEITEYVDRGFSGAKQSRPALDRLLADVRRRKVDVILVWAWDRLARSVKQLVGIFDECKRLGVGISSFSQQIDTSSPYGEMVFHVLAAVAQLERAIIAERVKSGLAAAKARGVQLGAKRIYSLDSYAPKVAEMQLKGQSVRQIASILGVSRGTVSRIACAKEGHQTRNLL